MKDAAAIDLATEGAAGILRPTGGAPTLVALVAPSEWTSAAEMLATR